MARRGYLAQNRLAVELSRSRLDDAQHHCRHAKAHRMRIEQFGARFHIETLSWNVIPR